MSDEGSKGSNRKFFVLRDGKIGSSTHLDQNQMTPNLADSLPTCPLEGLHGFFTGNVGELAHPAIWLRRFVGGPAL